MATAAARVEARYLSVVETAKHVRTALKLAFPSVKFSVRSDSYSGGASVRVSWVDGPTEDQVGAVSGPYSGATFDGQRDLKEYLGAKALPSGELVKMGADFVFNTRQYSAPFLTEVARLVDVRMGQHYSDTGCLPGVWESESFGSSFVAPEGRWDHGCMEAMDECNRAAQWTSAEQLAERRLGRGYRC